MTRTEWILGILLVVLLAVVIVLGALFWLRPGIGDPPARPDVPGAESSSDGGRTALLAYASAQAQAQAWQPDARLLRATATWPQGAGRAAMQSGAATWSFRFYSPGAGAIATISVIADEATLVAETEAEAPLSPQDVTGWNVDSPEAVTRALEAGGDRFLDGAGVTTLTMALTADNDPGRVEWLVSLFSNQTGTAFTTRLDATTGAVLDVQGIQDG